MKKIVLLVFIIMFSFFSKSYAEYDKLAYDFQFKGLEGGTINLNDFQNKVIVVVNVASRCGFTNQYEDLQNLWENYKKKDLIVIGVPTNNFKQEPSSNKEIKEFCDTNFGINFPMSEKTNVIGEDAHPFYLWAKKNYGKKAIPKWNFHKIIINKDGKIYKTYGSFTKPMSKKLIQDIEKLLE